MSTRGVGIRGIVRKKGEKMKKLLVLGEIIFVISGVYSLALAEGSKSKMMDRTLTPKMMDNKETMMGRSRMMGGSGMMGKMMMHMMMKREIVATRDGGVIVLFGNKLLKYDKDLNLKKEVKIKMDREEAQKMVKEMMEKCPLEEIFQEETMEEEIERDVETQKRIKNKDD